MSSLFRLEISFTILVHRGAVWGGDVWGSGDWLVLCFFHLRLRSPFVYQASYSLSDGNLLVTLHFHVPRLASYYMILFIDLLFLLLHYYVRKSLKAPWTEARSQVSQRREPLLVLVIDSWGGSASTASYCF